MTSPTKKSTFSRSSRKPKPARGLKRTVKLACKVPLAEVKDDLSRYLRLAEDRDIIITRHGKPAGVLIGFATEDDWFDYRLAHDPRFLRKVSEARVDIAAGRGVRLEDL
jgi:prevent-host-death family protein